MKTRVNDDPIWLWLAFSLLGLSYLLPNHYPPWLSFHSEFLAAAAFPFLLIAVYAANRARGNGVPLPAIAAACAAVAGAPIVQAAAGLVYFNGDAFMAASYILAFAASIALGYQLREAKETDRWPELLAGVVIFVGLISVYLQLLQWLGIGNLGYLLAELPPAGRPFANLAQPNQTATLLTLALLGTLWLHQRRRLRMRVVGLAVALLSWGIVMTQSRTAWLELAMLLCGLIWLRKRADLLVSPRAVFAIGGAFLLFLLAWPIVADALYSPAGRTFEEQAGAGTRPVHWAGLLDAVARQPWFGYGWNQVAVAQANVVTDHEITGEMLHHSHNVVLDLLVWNGVPLGALFAGVIAWWVVSRGARLRSADSAFAWLAIVVILVHSLLEYPFAYLYFLLPLGLWVGLVEKDGNRSAALSVPKIGAVVGAGLSICLMGLVWHDYRLIEDDYRLMRFQMAKIGPLRGEAQAEAPEVLVLDQMAAELAHMRRPVQRGLDTATLESLRKVAYRHPSSPAISRYAAALMVNGHQPLAEHELHRIEKTFGTKVFQRQMRLLNAMARNGYPELMRLPQVKAADEPS